MNMEIERLFNTGGPMSRRRTERLRASIIRPGGSLFCPARYYAGLEFPEDADPVEVIEEVMMVCGYRSVGEARMGMSSKLPRRLMATMPCQRERNCRADRDDPQTVLRYALILGLSTAQVYDPERPVLWTRASLTRRIELVDLEAFYAAD
jgi:hypothetical protein